MATTRPGDVNKRACDLCHGMKVKCIKETEAQCARCRGQGAACTFDRSRIPAFRTDRERIIALEGHMAEVRGTLAHMTALLERSVAQTAEIAAGARQRTHHGPTLAQWVDTVGTSLGPRVGAPPVMVVNGVHDPQEDEYDYSSDAESTGEIDSESPPALAEDERRLPLRSLLRDEEARRLRKEGNAHLAPSPFSTRKRRRSQVDEDPSDAMHAPQRRDSVRSGRGPRTVEITDPIELGIVTEREGRVLFDMFMMGASAYMPVFDAADTFESIRESPLCLSAILMIGQMSADADRGRGSASGTRMGLKQHAENLAMRTLFSPVASIRIVQALILLASWGDTVWRPGNHALAIAVDIGLYRCLPHLVDTGMGRGMSGARLEEDRDNVAGARVWLALTKLKLEMALNHGRPADLSNDDPAEYRRLLDHPLSIPADSRCIAACEIMTHRQRQLLQFPKGAISSSEVDQILVEGNATFDEWEEFWTRYYIQKGVSPDDFLVSELAVQKCHSILHFNYHVLHGVHSRADVACLPDSRRQWLVTSLKVADSLVARMAEKDALARLRFANHYAFVALAFAAQYLIRLARILPGILDLPRTVANVVALADKLDQFPGFSFRKLLHTVAMRARRDKLESNFTSRCGSPEADPGADEEYPDSPIALPTGSTDIPEIDLGPGAGILDESLWLDFFLDMDAYMGVPENGR